MKSLLPLLLLVAIFFEPIQASSHFLGLADPHRPHILSQTEHYYGPPCEKEAFQCMRTIDNIDYEKAVGNIGYQDPATDICKMYTEGCAAYLKAVRESKGCATPTYADVNRMIYEGHYSIIC